MTSPVVSSSPPTNRAHAQALLRTMLLIRRFEEKAAEVYQIGKIRGFLHLYIGQEAVAVGAMQAITPDDAVVATYREHGHALARGVSADVLMAEMFGKATGCSRGRGGSMHFFDATRRFYGGYAIVGGGLPIAVGLALADRLQGNHRVTACFFGEGAVVEGEFHESLNLAALWKLPVLFCCENNRYAMGTAIERSHAVTDVAQRARAYGIEAEAVDGMDVLAVERATSERAQLVRERMEPQLLEFRTYRFRGHSMADPQLYRSQDEVERWKARDPIPAFQRLLQQEHLISDQDLARIETSVDAEIEAAVAFAEASPWEPVEDVAKFVTSR
ncbi:MAG TPA: pyruvate dehydrogenase (acetyl-transferring) E1 component subunit alpha [Chloroflexota bacterium]|nr:pyruvate dehydrogenase (acetyl-transferring) E1 component subunit alpha [Chloroflexota bacterium]